MKSINKLICIATLAITAVSCTEQYDCKLNPTKPDEVKLSEYLNSFDVLKKYSIDRVNAPFQLGAYISSSDFLAKELPYSMVCNNFQALEVGKSFTPVSAINENGEFDFSTLQALAEETNAAGITLFGGILLSHKEQRAEYLNGLIAPEIIIGERDNGNILINDFESDALGTTYPMTGNSAATVVNDPAGGTGKVLGVGSTATPANQSFPILTITLPNDLTLGNCLSLVMDFNATSTTGLYGQGMRMGINDNGNASYKSASEFGCPGGSWGKGLISLDFSALNLTAEEKALTTFNLKLGSATGAGVYYIDNIKIYWETGSGDQIIEKPEEEKKEILTAELSKWIGGSLNASEGLVKAWNVIDEPLDASASDANTFQWKDYFGNPGYARTAVKMARDNAATALDLFVSSTFELDNNPVQKAEDLIALIAAWEADNVTKIEGINVLLSLNYSKNPTQQQTNEAAIGQLFEKLAASGKQIRISDLKMSISNATGTVLRSAAVTADDRLLVADYYTFVLKKYFGTIAKGKQYGISLAQISETQDGTTICPWNVNNDRTDIYIGIVDGLE